MNTTIRASYIPVYYRGRGPLKAVLVTQNFSVHDGFVDVNIIDVEHLRSIGSKLKQQRALVAIVKVARGQYCQHKNGYAIYVTPA